MKDCTAGAETLFRDFAARYSLSIEKVHEPRVELLMRLPQQRGLSFELTLVLQNADELSIGFEKFRSYFFPFEDKGALGESALNGIATGNCRLASHKQLGGIVKRVLELRTNGRWQPIYSAFSRFQIPFIGTAVSHLYNSEPAGGG